MRPMRPFWRYYGGKWRAAPLYPAPLYNTIVEPFAGSAGYSMRYPNYRVILVEKYPVIAEMWRYLINVRVSEVMRIPCVDHVDELPSWVPQGGRYLVGFCMNDANVRPSKSLSIGKRRYRELGHPTEGWTEARRARVASQLNQIGHWEIIEGDYTDAPDIVATWFVDPPYNNRHGACYVHHDLNYEDLGEWCQTRRGQTLVCENEGATWLPFNPFDSRATTTTGLNGKDKRLREVLWQRHTL